MGRKSAAPSCTQRYVRRRTAQATGDLINWASEFNGTDAVAMSSHILLIEDDSAVAAAVNEALRVTGSGSYEVEWVRRCSDGLERLAKERLRGEPRPDPIAAVLVNLFLPDSVGLDTFDRLFRATRNIPILVLSGAADEDSARQAMRLGAQDYLLKERLDSYSLLKALNGAVERAAIAGALFAEKERAQVTLNSIGDAVVSTDVACRVTYLNAVAERLTGWSREEAIGLRIEEVFQPIDAATQGPVPNSMALAISGNVTLCLAPNCILIRRDGCATAIEDSAAPIHDRTGRVTGAVMVFRDVSDARAQSQRLAYSAEHDGLTDLPNRVLFNDRLLQALAMAQRNRHKMAVLYMDLDRFKPVNDVLGHDIGDQLLQSVARRLTQCVRSSDTVGRQGGDEFLILLSEVARAQDAEVIAEKILLSLATPHQVDDQQLEITASIGIATYPDDGADAESLLKQADFAMYHAKYGGGNHYRYFNPALSARAVNKRRLEFPPPYDLAPRTTARVEALV